MVEAMTSGRAETVWSRGCAAWMASIDVADVMRDDFWLGQVESHGATQPHLDGRRRTLAWGERNAISHEPRVVRRSGKRQHPHNVKPCG